MAVGADLGKPLKCFQVGQDLIFDKSLRDIRLQADVPKGSMVFDPYLPRYQKGELKAEDLALDHVQLREYATKATAIRERLKLLSSDLLKESVEKNGHQDDVQTAVAQIDLGR